MEYEASRRQLREVCSGQIEAYRQRYPEKPPLNEHIERELTDPRANKEDIYACFETLIDIYDELLAVDSTPYRDAWRDHILYDCSRQERLEILGSDLPASLTLVWISGRYAGRSGGYIGVNSGRRPEPAAYSTLASELLHAYQDQFDSPTLHHPYLMEGMDLGAAIRALEQLGDEWNDDAITHLATRQRTQALLQGVIAHGIQAGGNTAREVRSLGLTQAEFSELRTSGFWQLLGYLQPRQRWTSTAFLPEYHLYGSVLLVSDTTNVSATYAKAFHGQHPWKPTIDDIRSISPGWFWQVRKRISGLTSDDGERPTENKTSDMR